MQQAKDLTKGNILTELLKLSFPIMATSLAQMAYNLTDIVWLGRVGSDAVAAVGTAGFFMWFGIALLMSTKIGSEVTVSQSLGRKDLKSVVNYAQNSISMALIISLLYGIIVFFIAPQLISFFKLKSAHVVSDATIYLRIVSMGTVFAFTNPTFSGVYNGLGNSKMPFYINSIGLIMNIFLDPLLIFGVGPFPEMGAKGAAIATVISQIIVFSIFFIKFHSSKSPIYPSKLLTLPKWKYVKEISRIGSPIAIQSTAFSVFSMFIARILATWGPTPIAIQKVGSQIEAISWMTASGFSTALASFTGQNFGANIWVRVKKGYWTAIGIMFSVGLLTSFLMIVFPKQIISLFLSEPEAIKLGIVYLRILGISQVFMCLEITTFGGFNGIGRTVPPSVVSFIFTGLRVPSAYLLTKYTLLGLNAVWWTISVSSILKGTILVSWYLLVLYGFNRERLKLSKKKIIKWFPRAAKWRFWRY